MGGFITKYFGDPDIVFGYSTPATVRIRDCRLGVAFAVCEFLIFTYVVVYQVVLAQGYRKQGDLHGVVDFSIASPDAIYRRPAPQCENSL